MTRIGRTFAPLVAIAALAVGGAAAQDDVTIEEAERLLTSIERDLDTAGVAPAFKASAPPAPATQLCEMRLEDMSAERRELAETYGDYETALTRAGELERELRLLMRTGDDCGEDGAEKRDEIRDLLDLPGLSGGAQALDRLLGCVYDGKARVNDREKQLQADESFTPQRRNAFLQGLARQTDALNDEETAVSNLSQLFDSRVDARLRILRSVENSEQTCAFTGDL
ncbi:hypothetical protein P2H44_25245 [Albimonas sp. CAU 1670]|uniref:hypothetical protein n=1 Tax=Albimonas sp. CAU 1670 TaxID=3032599 RepID=UPI0023DB442E|nr:hypothetical protein [Albimonas sp. CAU 1670]MDF2235872.1 hypothetical protein [Albimonas sp. CAU 1670]